MINKLGPALSWRLVHDGTVVLMLEQVSGMTETMHQAFEAQSLRECMEKAVQLGLHLPQDLAPPERKPESVALEVSPRQIRQAMNRTPHGDGTLRDAVEVAVAASGRDMQDWWAYSTVFERQNPQVEAVARVLGVDAVQVDALWVLAGSL